MLERATLREWSETAASTDRGTDEAHTNNQRDCTHRTSHMDIVGPSLDQTAKATSKHICSFGKPGFCKSARHQTDHGASLLKTTDLFWVKLVLFTHRLQVKHELPSPHPSSQKRYFTGADHTNRGPIITFNRKSIKTRESA